MENLLGKHNSRPYNPLIANTFFRAGYIEAWGRGIQKIRESCKENGNKMAEYQVNSSEIMVVFYGLPMQKDIFDKDYNTQDGSGNTQDNTQDGAGNTQDNSLTDKGKRILAVCTEPKSKQEIAEFLGYKSIKSIKAEMERLLNENKLTMTIPDKPKSKNQKYVVMKCKRE